MKKWKSYQICIFVLACILLNFAGRELAAHFEMPLWLDSLGTVLTAFAGGPICGSIVGITGNLLYSMSADTTAVYALTGIAVAFTVGLGTKYKAMKTLFGAITLGAITALVAIAVSLPLNVMLFDGSTGNVWGDGVIGYVSELGWPRPLQLFFGQFLIEFVDKQLTVIVLFIIIKFGQRLRRRYRDRRGDAAAAGGTPGAGNAAHAETAANNGTAMPASAENTTTPQPAAQDNAPAKSDSADKAEPQAQTSTGAGGTAGAAKALCALLLAAACALMASPAARAEADALTAQNTTDYNDFVQTVYSSSNGLPCGEANAIAQTRDGILWIGTYAGLYRYNGREFRWMSGYDSVRNVNCLYADEEGRLWIGTNDNGLSIVINEEISNVIDKSDGLPSNSVRSIVRSADGYYYVGTTGSMQVFSLNSGLKRVGTLGEINYSDRITADSTGLVATVTNDGRLFLLRAGIILSSLRLTDGMQIFSSCYFDDDGLLLVGTSQNTIYAFDVSGGGFEQVYSLRATGLVEINDMRRMESGELLLAADNGAGYITHDGVYHPVNTNEFCNSIDNLLVDYQGNLWFTSSRLGLLRMAHSAFRDIYSTVGMTHRVVNAVAYSDGYYYFGTDGGLDIVDSTCKRQIKNELTSELDGIRIRCVFADDKGTLWICTYGNGLLEYEADGTQHWYNSENGSYGDRSRMAFELSDGTIFTAGDTGLSFIRDHKIVNAIGMSKGLINSLILTATEMPDGTLYVGTDGDGIGVLRDGKITAMLTSDNGLSSDVILRTTYDPKGNGLFIVTSNGLCYMDGAGEIRPLNNFPYFNNYDVWLRDEDTLFVLGSAGIYVVSRDDAVADLAGMNYDLLDARRGLNSALTANSWCYSNDAGELFLPCDTGVFVVNTDRYSFDIRSFRMMINGMALDGEYTQLERYRPVQIARGVSRVEFYPEVLNFTIDDPFVGYQLNGFDAGWTIMPCSSLASIMYTNLPSGEYTLRLAVFDTDQETILEERDYRVEKEHEIYDYSWFKTYMALVAVFAVAWLTWFLVRIQVRRTLELQHRELKLAHQQIQMGNETIIAIAKAVDAKDERTSQHSQRVSQYSVMIAQRLGFSQAECENLRKAAQMHDIGKIGIPDNILNKPARLTDEEYAIMKSHVVRGAEILKDFTLIDHVVEGALHHHERYDGRGYPSGLKGEEIPLYGRIIGVADAFDAMTANRVYRKQMDFDYVLNEMRKGRGTQFDPQIVDILLQLVDEGDIDLNALYGTGNDAQQS